MSKKKSKSPNTLAGNKKAFFNYRIEEKLEAGIVLAGCEVKSIREGKAVLADSYIRLIKGEAWLYNCYIPEYTLATHKQEDTKRKRKLLLNQNELKKLDRQIEQKNAQLLPLSLYLKNRRVKVCIGVGHSKKQFDKRHAIKEKENKRNLDRAIKYKR